MGDRQEQITEGKADSVKHTNKIQLAITCMAKC